MKRRWMWFLCLFLIGAALGIHLTPQPEKPLPEVAQVDLSLPRQEGPTPFVPTATSAYRMAQGYQALDVFHYFLYAHRLVYADFPHSVDYTPDAPTSFVGFTDQSEADTPQWGVIAVFETVQQAQNDYWHIKNTSHDAVVVYNRCITIAATYNATLDLYFSFLRTVCN